MLKTLLALLCVCGIAQAQMDSVVIHKVGGVREKWAVLGTLTVHQQGGAMESWRIQDVSSVKMIHDPDNADGLHAAIAGPVITAFPNPAHDRVTIQVTGAPAGGTVQIHDGLGRLVRTWHTRGADAVGAIHWDGRDDAGRILPQGIYHLRAGTSTTTSTQSLLIIH